MSEWREEDDPKVLAAAVAAGVKVRGGNSPAWPSSMVRARGFAECIEAGTHYWLPADWQPTPEPPADDLRERRVWTCKIGGRVGRLPAGADLPMRRAVADAFTAETGHPVEFCFSGWGDDLDESELAVVEDREPDPEVIRAALVKRLAVLPAPPAPPWPGAVLSGLCDEDGQPTWLAQAGQVRGEQVRGVRNAKWRASTTSYPTEWVEVRAPRAVPVPETERVELWDAVGRSLPDGREIVGWQWSTEARDGSVTHDDCTWTPVHDAPTVEVLKDGDR